jgi:two-component system, LytTR family, response regulator
MAGSRPLRTLIIDDEPPAVQRLKELISSFPDIFEIAGGSSSPSEAILEINRINPDLIFLDIQMPGMNGFELLKKINRIPLIVFCTAYDQYSLQAFETNSIDYLIKPVSIERLEKTVKKLDLIRKNFDSERIMNFLNEISKVDTNKIATSLAVRKGNRIIFIKLSEIIYLQAQEKYVSIFSKDGKENLTEKTVKDLELTLPDNFLRVHRSIIINVDFIKEFQTYFNSRYIIYLNDLKSTRIVTGRSHLSKIKNWMRLNN